MKKLILLALATAGSWVLMLPKQAEAASFSLTVTENVTDSSTPAPGIPNLYVYKNLVSGQGQITSIQGFSSLAGVSPSSLTLNFGNLVKTSLANQNGTLVSTFGGNGLLTPFFNLFKDGQVIATSNNIQVATTLNAIPGSPSYGQGTQTVSIMLGGVNGNPFYQEVQQLTHGTGRLEILLGTPTAIKASGAVGTVADRNSFTFTGGTLVAPTQAVAVPEPATELGTLTFGVLLVTGLGLKRKLRDRSKIQA